MDSLNFTVTSERCTRCGACANDCVSHIIQLPPQDGAPFVADSDATRCLHCQHCLAVCPTGAVSIDGCRADDSQPPASFGAPPSEAQMRGLVRGRRSVRQFAPNDVEPALINRLLDDLAYTPTGCNARELRMHVIAEGAVMDKFRERMFAAFRERAAGASGLPDVARFALEEWKNGRDLIFRGAPHALIISAPLSAPCPREDVALALAQFELLAVSAGLGTTWCGLLAGALALAPSLKPLLGLPTEGAHFYAMLFGVPSVSYARTVQRRLPDGAITRVSL